MPKDNSSVSLPLLTPKLGVSSTLVAMVTLDDRLALLVTLLNTMTDAGCNCPVLSSSGLDQTCNQQLAEFWSPAFLDWPAFGEAFAAWLKTLS